MELLGTLGYSVVYCIAIQDFSEAIKRETICNPLLLLIKYLHRSVEEGTAVSLVEDAG